MLDNLTAARQKLIHFVFVSFYMSSFRSSFLVCFEKNDIFIMQVMSNEQVTECIRGIENGKTAAEELITEALESGSCDDISCVVVKFH